MARGSSLSMSKLQALLRTTFLTASMVSAGTGATAASPAAQAAPVAAGFANPGASARPRVWWHWMNGNITWEGARLDMEWMKRIGIAGLQSFDAGAATP